MSLDSAVKLAEIEHDDVYTALLAEAVMAFNRGLELGPDTKARNSKRASYLRRAAVDMVGEETFDRFSFIVTAQSQPTQRNLAAEAKMYAAKLYQQASEESSGPNMNAGTSDPNVGYGLVQKIQKQLETMGAELKQTAEEIGGYSADLMNRLNALVKQSPMTGKEQNMFYQGEQPAAPTGTTTST